MKPEQLEIFLEEPKEFYLNGREEPLPWEEEEYKLWITNNN